MSYPRLWARVYNAPLLIHPDKARIIEEVFRLELEGGQHRLRLMEDDAPAETEAQRKEREHAERQRAYTGIALQRRDDKPYALTTSGIALIPVLGTLVQRGSWLDSMSGLTSYDTVASLLERSLSDPDVRGLLLEIDSPGGEAAGMFDLANRVYSARAQKPIWGHVNEQAYSAAYGLAAGAARLYTPITGGVGSIGAVMLHVDQSKRDAMMGLKYTFIYSGAHKVDGNSHEPLKDSLNTWAQGEVDRTRELFAQSVAKYRNLSVDAVLATEAALLNPPQGLEGGYIDGVATLVETVTLLESELRQPGSTQSSSGTRMVAGRPTQSNPKETSMKTASPAATLILAALSISMESVSEANGAKLESAILAVVDPARTEARAEGAKEGEAKGQPIGAKAERERVRAILAHAEAKERQDLALSVATETDMTVEQAGSFLAKAPKQAAGSQLAALMAKVPNPKVGVDVSADPAGEAPRINTRAIYERFNERAS